MTDLSQSNGMPVLVDLFCGAGGAAAGYKRAGFYVIGVDNRPQPRYAGDVFFEADALTFPLTGAHAVHASPPCHANSSLRFLNPHKSYVDLIDETRERLVESGLPYVIENVVGARLLEPIKLCGSMFGLKVRRHRLFECSFPVLRPKCQHGVERPWFPVTLGMNSHRPAGTLSPVAYVYGSTRYKGELADRRRAMDIDWMSNAEITQAIPPAYTELLGHQLMRFVDRREAVAA